MRTLVCHGPGAGACTDRPGSVTRRRSTARVLDVHDTSARAGTTGALEVVVER